jgi:hypothetical protein
MSDIYNGSTGVKDKQDIYDAFNHFIFSQDRDVFNKLIARAQFYDMVKDLHGDIVECGVFKGSGMMTWLKLLDIDEHHSIRKVIGFDFFDQSFVDKLDPDDKVPMKSVFDRCNPEKDISKEVINYRIIRAGFSPSKFELVQGNIIETTQSFIKERPGFRISILYMDLDLGEPTRRTLLNLHNLVVPGGVIVFDEYAYHTWTETDGVDEFLEEYPRYKLHRTNIKAPTAYIIKE